VEAPEALGEGNAHTQREKPADTLLCRRGNRRVAIAWVAGKRKRAADCDIMASRFKPVMIALLRHLISGKRRRRIIGHRTRMRTAGQR
jgi:hypothetical protein